MKIKMKSNLQAQGSRPAAWPGDIIDMDDAEAKNLIQCGFAEAVGNAPAAPAQEAPEAAAVEPAENAAMPKPQRKQRSSRKVK